MHVLALAVFTVLLVQIENHKRYFELIVTIESDSMILVAPCQLTIVYANN